jgi:hypothetical protein
MDDMPEGQPVATLQAAVDIVYRCGASARSVRRNGEVNWRRFQRGANQDDSLPDAVWTNKNSWSLLPRRYTKRLSAAGRFSKMTAVLKGDAKCLGVRTVPLRDRMQAAAWLADRAFGKGTGYRRRARAGAAGGG